MGVSVAHHRQAGFEHLLYSFPNQRAGIRLRSEAKRGLRQNPLIWRGNYETILKDLTIHSEDARATEYNDRDESVLSELL